MSTALIVDDHKLFRAVARELVELEGFRVTAETGSGQAAVALGLDLEPDLVLLDVSLPDISGFEVAERLAEGGCQAAIVIVSNRDKAELAPRVARSPVLGLIPKDELSGETLMALLSGRLG
jgi:two-component system response regulator DegU